ncbi:phosphoesterase [Sulfolobus acidocaldarius SUSAZ]|nr:phosphoesterase [Sulfolobus acidocaldarius SUSAZ]
MISIFNDIYIAEDLPVLYIKPLNAVVLSDVHIGFEQEMANKGIYIPKVQKKRFLTIYRKALDYFKTNKLIINGDFKHTFNKITKQERDELTEILTELNENKIEVKIVKGNHDNYISAVTEKFSNVELVEDINVNDISIFHGHKRIDVQENENKVYIIGHEHPRLSIKDRLGFARKLQCFLKVPLRNNSTVIVLPATGTYQSGNDVTLSHSTYMSHIMREHSILEKARPYVIVEGQGIMEFPELGLLKDIIHSMV